MSDYQRLEARLDREIYLKLADERVITRDQDSLILLAGRIDAIPGRLRR